MSSAIFSFFFSFFFSLIIIRYKNLFGGISTDKNFTGPQKFHLKATSRIGGLGIYFAIISTELLGYFYNNRLSLLPLLLISALPTFLIGFIEDITQKVGIKMRLLFCAASALIAGYYLNIWIVSLDISLFDWMLSFGIISIALTVIAIAGLSNAYNIIDGFNGLSSMVAMISLSAIGYVAFKVNDFFIVSACLTTVGAIAGFFFWNYPKGFIFLGDCGAYLIGFLVATISILLVNRNIQISPWFCLLVNMYPIFETLFTIWRRKIYQGKNPGLPDGSHLHSLIYRRLINWSKVAPKNNIQLFDKNAKTSPHLWVLSSLAVFPSIIWWDSTFTLQCFATLFCISYCWAYRRLVKFKTPKIFN